MKSFTNKPQPGLTPRRYVTIAEAWKHVFGDVMGSRAPIHIPISKGIFKPEIHPSPPTPCELSVSDLCAVGLMHLLCGVGVQHRDFGRPLLFLPKETLPDHLLVATAPQAGGYSLFFAMDGVSPAQARMIFPDRDPADYHIGPDRVMQEVFQAQDFAVDAWVTHRPVPLGPGMTVAGTVWFVPENDVGWRTFIEHGRFDGAWDGGDAQPRAENWRGLSLFQVRAIHAHVLKRLSELD